MLGPTVWRQTPRMKLLEMVNLVANISAKAAMVALHAAFSDRKKDSDQ